MRKLITILASITTLSACGTKLPGGLTIPGGGGSAGNPAASSGGGGGGGALGAYYASLDHATLRPLFQNASGDDVYEKAKADVGREALWQSPNPDPEWIKAWGTQDWTNASENAEVMFQAAFNRSWDGACAAEADATFAAHARLAKAHAVELARVDALTNYYERMAGYAALFARFEEDARGAGLTPEQRPLGPVGFRVEILARAIAYHQASPHGFVEFPWDRFGAAAERTRKDGRALTADAAFERHAYCAAAASQGGRELPPFTSIIDGSNTRARKLAWPTVWGDEDAVKARTRKLREDTARTLATRGGARVERVEKAFGVSFPEGEPKLASFQAFTVDAARGPDVMVSRTDVEHYDYACRETTKIDRIEDGKIRYRVDCKTGKATYHLVADVRFAELPPGLTLAKGDVIYFYADLDQSTLKKIKDTAAHRHTGRKMTLTGRHLAAVTRGRDKLTW